LTECPPAGFAGEQVAEAKFCLEGEFCFGRDGVCARGPFCTPVILRVPSGVGRRRACTMVARVITVGESLIRLWLSHKVPDTLGTRNGNEERGTSVKATWNVEGYTANPRSFDAWNVFPTI
jgi:hypothetical protein